ncbi:leucine-rich repeat flightless-interacting protein 2-like isoform X27 [Polyodon spathula]|uniref:leucine-rich repeat flightless-interacting protein 2-like isoform X27 n=1 Tax=Polyodon spathula TaxID=7913 RepID=UPI001B7F4FD6|nr:leucine-rich repeat flightless-interacting protein 2-like isoform X27 [Polyodon spathula]
MGTQGSGRKRIPNRERLTAEDDALNLIAREAESRLAAKRAARAEAREIRMKELERQQKEIYQVQKKYYGLDNKWGDIEQWMEDSERYSRRARRNTSMSDDDERMSVGSRGSLRSDFDSTAVYGGAGSPKDKPKKKSSKATNGFDEGYHGSTQSRKSSRSSRHSDESRRSQSSRQEHLLGNHYSSDLYSNSGLSSSSRAQSSAQNGTRPSMLCSDALLPRSLRGSLYEESVHSGTRRFSASSSRAPSEYSGFPGSSSRASSRASSARASPVLLEDSSSIAGFLRSSAHSSSSSVRSDLDDVTIPDFPDVEERPERDFAEKGSRSASTLSAATLASLGGSSSRRGSGDTSISADTEASIREIKDIHELKDQIQDVESRYMQGLKEMKDSLAEVEEKYRKAMVSNAQLDNEKSNFMFQVDTMKDSLMELEEQLAETRRELDEKVKEHERERHAHSVLKFQFNEMKENLRQSEELLAEIRQLKLKQESSVREVSDLQETIEWKDKKIGALERQKEYFDVIRTERDELRDEIVLLKDVIKKHGIVLGAELTSNGEVGDAVLDSTVHTDSVKRSASDSTPVLQTPRDGLIEIRLRKLVDEKESLLEQIRKLKIQLDDKRKNVNVESMVSEEEVLENGTDVHVMDLQRDSNRQISDLKFKLVKSEQEVTTLEQNVIRLEGQVTRYKSASENAEKVEDDLKAEKRKLQRELRTALDKIDELEVGNSHLVKRLEKMKANRSALMSQQ